ncbi:MAG: hypothetical protein AB7N80_05820 [Bdellovibrionales bacterium]
MLDFMFFVKTLALTFVIVIAMQTPWGDATIEDHAIDFARSSVLVQPLQRAASSGAQVVRQSMQWLSKQVNQKIRGQKSTQDATLGGRGSGLQFKRSEGYERKKAEAEAERKSDSAHE